MKLFQPKASTPPEANIGDAGATLKDTAEAPKAEVKVDQTPAPVQVDTSKTTTEWVSILFNGISYSFLIPYNK